MDPAFGAALGACVTGLVSVCVQVYGLRQTKRLQADKTLHERRVEQIERLYAAIEAAVHHVLLEADTPDEGPYGSDQLQALRETHSAARIYLTDKVDRICLDLLEELDRAFAAACTSSDWAWTDVGKIPEGALEEMRALKDSQKIARETRDRLRVALRDLLRQTL